jgi:hypothetical protein
MMALERPKWRGSFIFGGQIGVTSAEFVLNVPLSSVICR